MKDQRKVEIKVGATVIVGLLIMIAGFAAFREWSLFTTQKQIMMRFPTSAGLQSGDVVSLNGVEIGKVASVALDNSSVVVVAEVQQDASILDGAEPRIQMLELMGGKKIEIMQGAGPGEIPANTVLQGAVDPDIAGALHLMGELEGNVRSLGENANELMENANAIIGDEAFVAAVKDAAQNLRSLVVETRTVLAENRKDIREIAVTMNGLSKNVDTLLAGLEPRLSNMMDKSDRTLTSADSLIESVTRLVDDVRTGNGLVSRALYDTTMTHTIDRMMARVDSVLKIIIDEDMKIRIRL